MYSTKSYQLRKDEFNYLLPVLKNKLSTIGDRCFFVGTSDDLDDMLNRLKGLYDYYNDLNNMIYYKCFKEGRLISFRNELVKEK